MKYRLYYFFRPIIFFVVKLVFRVSIVGNENIPKKDRIILAGNHKSYFDCLLVMASTKRMVRFIAKKELLDGKFSFIFKKMGIIPVDRKAKNKKAITTAVDVLNNDGVIGIFPEGTFNETEYVTMPFKVGAVKMAYESDAKIVPFAIIGNYKPFRKSVKIVFGKAYKLKDKDDLKKENIALMNKVIRLLKNGNN